MNLWKLWDGSEGYILPKSYKSIKWCQKYGDYLNKHINTYIFIFHMNTSGKYNNKLIYKWVYVFLDMLCGINTEYTPGL